MFGSIVEAIKHYANSNYNKLCLVDDSLTVSYGAYFSIIKKLSRYFFDKGIKKNTKVVVEANQSILFVAIEHSLHLLGAIFVPLEHKCGSRKLASVAGICKASLVVSNLACEEYNSVTYTDIQCSLNSISEISDYELPDKNEISEILFSTGTTGKEKGIVLTHGSSVAVAENIANAVDLVDSNIELIPSPLNHSHGLRSYYANMLRGGAVIIVSNVMDMKRFFSLIEEYNVNSMDLVPAALTIILRLSKNKLGDYKEQFRYIEFGSAAMADGDKAKIKELLPGIPLYNFYGSTESGRVTVSNFNTTVEKKGSIGKPTCNVTLKIVNDEGVAIESSINNTGLLATAGSMNMLCYYEDEEETKAALIDGFIYSKDEAYIDKDGDIILLGRKGDVINVGGKKVSPSEIENIAIKVDWVEDCGCIGVKNQYLGAEPKLYVQVKNGCSYNPIELKLYLAKYLEPFKVPQLLEPIEKIPRTFNGKLLRRELQKLNEE